MKKRLKKSIYFILAITILILGINNVNAADDNLKTCKTEKRTYYFNYRSKALPKTDITIKHDRTMFYDQLPTNSKNARIIYKNARWMYREEYQDYLNLLNNSALCKVNNANGVRTCTDNVNHRYTNTGLEDQEKFEIIPAERVVIPEQFSVGKVYMSGSTLVIENIERIYGPIYDAYVIDQAKKGNEYGVPGVLEIIIEYRAESCEEETVDEPEPPENHCGETADTTPGKLSCSDGDYKYTQSVNISTSRTITSGTAEYNYYNDQFGTGDWCSNTLSESITASATINQEGTASFSLAPRTIYSGGGFDFSASYFGTISYQFCNEPLYTITKKYWVEGKCPTGTTESGSQCTKIVDRKYNQPSEIPGYDCTYDTKKCYPGSTAKNCYYCVKREVSDKTQTCTGTKTISFQSNSTTYSAPYNGGSNELQKIYSYMATNYLQDVATPEPSTVKSKDSNKVTSGTKADTSMGSDWDGSFSAPTMWYPDEILTLDLVYDTKKACINVKTAKVTYKYTCDEGTEIEGNATYYTPLKQKDNTKFPVSVYIDNVSMTSLVNWEIDYECDVTCRQKLYEEPKGYKFVYRPIQLGTVNAVFPNRAPGSNWTNISSDTNLWNSNMTKRDKLEYEITLTPSTIANLRNYTDYADLSTITKDGTSSFLDGYRKSGTKYSGLGVCTKDCW